MFTGQQQQQQLSCKHIYLLLLTRINDLISASLTDNSASFRVIIRRRNRASVIKLRHITSVCSVMHISSHDMFAASIASVLRHTNDVIHIPPCTSRLAIGQCCDTRFRVRKMTLIMSLIQKKLGKKHIRL